MDAIVANGYLAPMLYTVAFLTALGLSLAVELWLDQRQMRAVRGHRERVPEAFRARVSLAEHQKAADYTLARLRLARVARLWDAAVLLWWTLGGGLQWAWDLTGDWGLAGLHRGVGVIVVVGLLSALLHLPFSIYRTFVIEARFGFNRTTPALFVTDLVKGTALALALGVPLLYLILWLMERAGPGWWLWAWAAWFGFTLLLSWAYPTLIAPLFNRFTPLEDASLRQAIEDLLARSGFHSRGIYVMDGSRRSGHGNAYFTGLGRNKRIVFFDTLLETLSPDETLAVLAHELGHYHYRHVLKGLLLSAVSSLLGFAVLAWLLPQPAFYHGLGVATPALPLGLLLFVLVAPVFTFFLQPLMAWYSRRHEFQADCYAARQTSARDLISALVRLYRDNASTLTPDPLYSDFHDSHPPAPVRIRHLQQCARH